MTKKLRDARIARGWSQARLIREIEQYAERKMLAVASSRSLRVYVSEWENGRRTISADYAAILRGLLGLTDSELLGSPTESVSSDGYADLVARVDSSIAIGTSVLDALAEQTELLRRMDRQLGAAALVDQVQAHLARMQEMLTFAVLPVTRRAIAQALADAASLAAWQALDVGAADRAWRHYELAKTAAREADDPLHLAHATGEQAYVLAEAGRPVLGLQLVQDAVAVVGSQLSPRLLAWLKAAEAELLALNGQPDACRRALDTAIKLLPDGEETRDPELPGVYLDHSHLQRWRGHSLALLGDEESTVELYAALASMDDTFVRARAGLHCDLAQAHLFRDEREEGQTQLRQARLVANRTGSIRHRRRIEKISQIL